MMRLAMGQSIESASRGTMSDRLYLDERQLAQVLREIRDGFDVLAAASLAIGSAVERLDFVKQLRKEQGV